MIAHRLDLPLWLPNPTTFCLQTCLAINLGILTLVGLSLLVLMAAVQTLPRAQMLWTTLTLHPWTSLVCLMTLAPLLLEQAIFLLATSKIFGNKNPSISLISRQQSISSKGFKTLP